MTSEKRGGLNVVSFDRSRFKLFMLRFSNKSVYTLFCKRPKITQQNLFLTFEINICFLIMHCAGGV
jgi:urease accessory protein UreH